MRRLLLLSGLVYGLLLLGLATLTGAFVALALPLAIYLIAALLYSPESPQLKVTRTLGAQCVQQDAPVRVQLSIANEGAGLEECLVEDFIPAKLNVVDGRTRALVALPAGGTITLEYTVSGKRGGFDFGAVRVTAGDHLGIFRRRRWFHAPARLLILPEVWRLRQVMIRPLRTRGYAGPIPARLGGSGTDFFGVREYQMGDPQRRINWRASARHPRALFTNEFELERVADVGLILDARRQTNIQSDQDALFEHAVRATAALAEAFLNDGNRVGLLIYGRGLERTFPGYGKKQRERILRALAQAEVGESMVFESFDYLPTRFFPPKSQIVLVSPLTPGDLPTLIRLRARGYELLVVSPDPVAFEAQALGEQMGLAWAQRIAYVERTLLLRRLQRVGVHIVDWRVDSSFDRAVRKSVGRRPQVLRALGIPL